MKETSWQNETCDRRFYKTNVAFLSNLLIIVERVYRYIYIYMDVNYFSKMKKKYLRSRSRVFLSFSVIRVLMLILPDVSTSSVIQMLTRKFFFYFVTIGNDIKIRKREKWELVIIKVKKNMYSQWLLYYILKEI